MTKTDYWFPVLSYIGPNYLISRDASSYPVTPNGLKTYRSYQTGSTGFVLIIVVDLGLEANMLISKP